MALTATVTKQSVTKTDHPDGNRYRITLLLEVKDDTETVLHSRSFSEQYVQGEPAATTQGRFIGQMQAAIDDYKAAKAIYDAAALDAACNDIAAALTL